VDRFRCCSYNVRNLFLSPRQNGAATAPGKRKAELRALAGVIDRLDADLIALQEVGSRGALAALNNLLRAPFAHSGLRPGNSDRGIELAVLSRWPLHLTSHAGQILLTAEGEVLEEYACAADAREGKVSPLRFQRDLLRCDVRVGTATVTVFNVHLKSPLSPAWRRLAAEQVRTAECRGIAATLERYEADFSRTPALLVGDFNDVWESPALRPIHELGFTNPLAQQMGAAGSPPTYWPKRGGSVDMVLAAPSAQAMIILDSGKVHASPKAQRGSDHYPVSLDLTLDWSG
jgi:endonuclease/exonuclease/phosphatase family metal-dependent hydrolase